MLWIIFCSTLMFVGEAKEPEKAKTCVACHGEKGISPNELWPNIAGQKKTYMINQMKAFKDGKRQDPLMTPISKDLTENEIKELADFYSKMKADK